MATFPLTIPADDVIDTDAHVSMTVAERFKLANVPAEGVVGPQGPQGPVGPAGAAGPAGADGAAGPAGPAGAAGAPGAAGAAGAKGDKGDPGNPGAAGTNGTNGNDGAPGSAGAKGDKGDKGDPGTPGTNGTNGAQGIPGTNGTNGAAGATGPAYTPTVADMAAGGQAPSVDAVYCFSAVAVTINPTIDLARAVQSYCLMGAGPFTFQGSAGVTILGSAFTIPGGSTTAPIVVTLTRNPGTPTQWRRFNR